ncbi:hypothetical protein [Reinekea sp.]|jgi:hypothetical protein|uniref:hypothetical protein n=1 Tax=Reinekea sp. TaxID=1970455 RepID=UPI00398945CC
MKAKLKQISTIVAQANDKFDVANDTIDTILGVIDAALRKQGIQADAITVDCVPLDKKIVFLLHDNKPEFVSIALGNKAGDIHSSNDHPINDVNVELVYALLVENFTQH